MSSDLLLHRLGLAGGVALTPPGVPTLLVVGGSATDQSTPYSTAIVTPLANRLLVGFFANAVASGTPNTVTPSGLGLAWSVVDTTVTGVQRLTLATALVGSSPATGAITITQGGQTQSGMEWAVAQVPNAAGLAQYKLRPRVTGSLGTSVTLDRPLRTFAGSIVVAAFDHRANEGATPTGGTKLGEFPHASPSAGIMLAYWTQPAGPTVAATWASSTTAEAIAAEVRGA